MIADPAAARVAADLAEADFVSGVQAGEWRVAAFTYPALDFFVMATEPDGTRAEYGFRAELTNFPAQAPMVRIWDHAANVPLAPVRRPRGNGRVNLAFQAWSSDTVYRPWDRLSGPHDSARASNLQHAWSPERQLSFIFRDLYDILNLNARALRLRTVA